MSVYRPYLQYIRVFLTSTLVAIIVGLLYPGNKLYGVLIIFGFGLVYILPMLVFSSRIVISEEGILTYYLAWTKKSVNLKCLTDCNYRLETGVRSMPRMVFHLYDADGGNATFPANQWLNHQRLYGQLVSAVTENKVSVNDKTANKLGLLLGSEDSIIN